MASEKKEFGISAKVDETLWLWVKKLAQENELVQGHLLGEMVRFFVPTSRAHLLNYVIQRARERTMGLKKQQAKLAMENLNKGELSRLDAIEQQLSRLTGMLGQLADDLNVTFENLEKERNESESV